jgi:hypothetical protein
MLMILPLPRSSICAPAARHRRNALVRLTAMTSSQSASEYSTAAVRRMIPALLTRMSIGASSAAVAASTRRAAAAGDARSATTVAVRTEHSSAIESASARA